MKTTRTTYRVARIRAEDLCDTDTAMIAGRWREVADAHTATDDEGWGKARDFYGDSVRRLIGSPDTDGPVGKVLVRYFLTGETDCGGIDDAFALLDRVELVEVQIADLDI